MTGGRLEGFVTSVGFEGALRGELGDPATVLQWPAMIGARVSTPDPVFARQRLPDATLVKGDSVRALATAVYDVVARAIDEAASFTLHAYVPDPGAYARLAGRAALLGKAVSGLLRERRRRAFRGNVEPGAPGTWSGELLVVQAALVARTSVVVSAARPRSLPHGGWDLAPWPAGIAPVAEDRAAPSRAYGKLEEGFAWLGAAPAPGERCVDLGGAPGGWAWRALVRGAEVLSVDRAPLAPPAAGHPALTTMRSDAFAYRPPVPVDWLLCDVICEPARTLELVERWMTSGWCRRLVATVKLKGRGGDHLLAPAARRMAGLGWRFVRMKHLHRHHNEVAVLAATDDAWHPAGR